MSGVSDRLTKNVAGLVLFLAMILGGGTSSGLYTDAIIQTGIYACLLLSLTRSDATALPRGVSVLLLLGTIAFAVQLLPLPQFVLNIWRPDVLVGEAVDGVAGIMGFVTLDGPRTFEAGLYAGSLAAFLIVVLRLSPENVHGLLPYFFAGLVCNIIAAAIQFSSAQTTIVTAYLPYSLAGGIFANQNHFSTLMFLSIPILVYFGLYRGMGIFSVIGLVAIVIMSLASGSTAGAIISFGILALAVLILGRLVTFRVIVVVMLVGVMGLGLLLSQLHKRGFNHPDHPDRLEFAETTLAGIFDNKLFGIGYGNFEPAYQIYEPRDQISSAYINHAHNDYLELIFEGGIFALIVIALYGLTLVRRIVVIHREPGQMAAFLGIGCVLVHSLVDYPMRTMAVAIPAMLLHAILFHTRLAEVLPEGREPPGRRPRDRQMERRPDQRISHIVHRHGDHR